MLAMENEGWDRDGIKVVPLREITLPFRLYEGTYQVGYFVTCPKGTSRGGKTDRSGVNLLGLPVFSLNYPPKTFITARQDGTSCSLYLLQCRYCRNIESYSLSVN